MGCPTNLRPVISHPADGPALPADWLALVGSPAPTTNAAGGRSAAAGFGLPLRSAEAIPHRSRRDALAGAKRDRRSPCCRAFSPPEARRRRPLAQNAGPPVVPTPQTQAGSPLRRRPDPAAMSTPPWTPPTNSRPPSEYLRPAAARPRALGGVNGAARQVSRPGPGHRPGEQASHPRWKSPSPRFEGRVCTQAAGWSPALGADTRTTPGASCWPPTGRAASCWARAWPCWHVAGPVPGGGRRRTRPATKRRRRALLGPRPGPYRGRLEGAKVILGSATRHWKAGTTPARGDQAYRHRRLDMGL